MMEGMPCGRLASRRWIEQRLSRNLSQGWQNKYVIGNGYMRTKSSTTQGNKTSSGGPQLLSHQSHTSSGTWEPRHTHHFHPTEASLTWSMSPRNLARSALRNVGIRRFASMEASYYRRFPSLEAVTNQCVALRLFRRLFDSRWTELGSKHPTKVIILVWYTFISHKVHTGTIIAIILPSMIFLLSWQNLESGELANLQTPFTSLPVTM